MKEKQQNSAKAEWSFLQNMANLGAFFSKPGLLGPDLQAKKSQIINVSESLQAATLVQLDSDLDKKKHKHHKAHAKSQFLKDEDEIREEKDLE